LSGLFSSNQYLGQVSVLLIEAGGEAQNATAITSPNKVRMNNCLGFDLFYYFIFKMLDLLAVYGQLAI
jgi:hypothetical protein